MSRLAIVLVTDDPYAGFAAVACNSMLENTRRPEALEIHLLHAGLSPRMQERLRQGIEERRGAVRFHDLRPQLALSADYPSPHFYRLLAPEVLPPEVERFLYLDCDVIVQGDVRAFAELDLAGNVVAACRDYIEEVHDGISNFAALGLCGNAPYLNSGVLWVDRAAWRGLAVSQRALACTRDNQPFLYAQGRFYQYDQYALNVVLYERWLMLEPTWNYGAEYPFRKANLVHFNGHGKPWSDSCTREFRDAFYSCLQRSGWEERELRIPVPEGS